MAAYRSATPEECEQRGVCDYYSLLLGPGEFECFLGEPEDRTWYRDGKNVVERLNELHDAFRYWSYCTRQGMLKHCPEKAAELRATLDKFGIEMV